MSKSQYGNKVYFVPQTTSDNIPQECNSKINEITNIKAVVSDFSEKIKSSGYYLSRATSQIVGYVKK